MAYRILKKSNRIISNNEKLIKLGNPIPRDGLIGEWLFNGTADDTSGNGHNGSVDGATLVLNRHGEFNSAYSFDGIDDGITVPFNVALKPEVFSYSYWVVDIGQNASPAISLWSLSSSNRIYTFAINLRNIESVYYATPSVISWFRPSIAEYPLDFDWHHIVAVHGITEDKIYLDGVLKITDYYAGSFAAGISGNTPTDLTFGSRIDSLFMEGKLDDIRLYGRELTQEEITALYNE